MTGCAAVVLAVLVTAAGWSPAASAAQAAHRRGGRRVHGASAAGVDFYTYQAPGGAATRGQKVIALTFDDGPGPYTPQVLSVLERYGVPATFFEVGREVAAYPQYTRMLAAAGYPVEDHTWSHPDLALIPVSEFGVQIDQTQKEISSITGTIPSCVRPPYDDWNPTVVSQISARGLATMSYSIDARDWTLPGVPAIVSNVVGSAFPGAVVDMHDGGGPRQETVDALPQIITGLRAEGYRFVSICGAAPPPPPAKEQATAYSFGTAPAPGPPVVSDHPLVGAAATPDGHGYWLDASDGGVFAYGDARFYGSLGATHLDQPIVGMAATPDGHGYWLVAKDGGVFAYGDAPFYGSLGGTHLDRPIVGMAADPATGGYWLLAADGGVFSFAAPFYGSRGGRGGPESYTSIVAAPGGRGYLITAQQPAG